MPDNDAFPETLVARLHAEATRLAVSIASPASDDQMNALLDELFVVTTRLAHPNRRDIFKQHRAAALAKWRQLTV